MKKMLLKNVKQFTMVTKHFGPKSDLPEGLLASAA
jgi:hypothetical protein